jgi:hypothetical protein
VLAQLASIPTSSNVTHLVVRIVLLYAPVDIEAVGTPMRRDCRAVARCAPGTKAGKSVNSAPTSSVNRETEEWLSH